MPFDVGSATGYLLLDTSGFMTGLKSAGKELNSFSGTASQKLQSAGTAISKTGATLTKTVTLPMLALGGTAVKTASDFESSMSQVQATLGATSDSVSTLDGQTVNTMDSLSDLAKELGASTKFSATEAAAAINNMAMAGYDVQEIYDSLPQVLSLASAGALDLDYATQLVANGLNVMGLETSDATELADKLAVTSTKAYGSVSDFGEGLLVAGAQAKLANVSLTDTMTALGILGDNGISASEGGTYLRNTLKNLYTPTDKAAEALDRLGIKTSDDNGKLKDFQVVLQELGVALDGLSEEERVNAMADIFDSRTISAANALIKNSGQRWDELSEAIDGSAGSAQQMADTQLNNLGGQLTILKSSLEGLAIAFGSLIVPIIKQATSFIQKIVDYLNNLDEAQKQRILKIAGIVAAVGPVLIVIGKVITILGTLGKVLSFLVANPVGLIIAAIAALVVGFIYLWNHCEGFRNFFINLWKTLKSVVSAVVDWFVQAWKDVSTFFVDLWNSISNFFSSVWESITGFFTGAWDAIVSVWQSVAEWFSTNVIEPIKAFFAPLFEWYVELFTSIWDFISSVFETIAEIAKGCWEIIKAVWGVVSSWFNDNIIEPLKKFFTALWDVVKNAATYAWEGIKIVWDVVSNWFDSKIIQPVTNFFSTMWDKLKQGAKGAWEGIKSVFSSVTSWFKDKFSAAWTAVKNVFSTGGKIFSGIKEGITAAFKKVVNAIISGLNRVIAVPFNAINRALDKIRGVSILGISPFSGLGSISVPQIPLLAQGGILKRGQIGLLEGSGAEAVVPLEKNLEWIQKVARELYTSLYDLLKNSGLIDSVVYSLLKAIPKPGSDPRKDTPSQTINNEYNFYSPQAIDPITARKMLKQTAQQLVTI